MLLLTKNNLNKILYFLLVLYLSFVYFSVAISNILLGLTLLIFIYGLIVKKTKISLSSKIVWFYALISTPFILTIISVLNSHNVYDSFKFIWIRFPILVLPIVILSLSEIDKEVKYAIASLYILFSLLATLLMFFNAINVYITHEVFLDPNFTKDEITPIQHPYFGISVLLATVTLHHFKLFNQYKSIRILILMLLSLGVVLSTSRTATLLLIVFWIYIILSNISKKFTYYIIAIGGILLVCFFTVSNPIFRKKIINTFSYWDSPRAWLWDNSYKVLKYSNNKISGTGIGDYYRIKRSPENFIHSQKGTYGYNPHNQYIEFFITNGVFGFLFVFAILYMLFISYKQKNVYSFSIIAIISIFSFTECILNRQFGVQLYAFFIPFSMLILLNNKD